MAPILTGGVDVPPPCGPPRVPCVGEPEALPLLVGALLVVAVLLSTGVPLFVDAIDAAAVAEFVEDAKDVVDSTGVRATALVVDVAVELVVWDAEMAALSVPTVELAVPVAIGVSEERARTDGLTDGVERGDDDVDTLGVATTAAGATLKSMQS